ncbi:MAG: right-handed parallel beta-helix repeat-containing protein [Fibrobacteria bacterium]
MIPAVCAILISCIERSNPFDPINSAPQAVIEVRKRDKPALVAITDGESVFTAFLMGVLAKFTVDSAANADRTRENARRLIDNKDLETANAAVESSNRTQASKDSLRLMAEYVPLDSLKTYGPYAGFAEHQADLHNLAGTLTTHFTLVNYGNFPLVVYNPAFIDSVLVPFVRDSVGYARAKTRFDSASIAVKDSNLVISAYNRDLEAKTRQVWNYNDSILFVKRIQNVSVIVRSDSLQAGAFTAKAGDSLFLGPGTFNVDLRFANTGTLERPIVVSGFPGHSTIIRPLLSGSKNSLVLDGGQQHIRFVNLVFRGGVEGNVKLVGGASGIKFRNCIFDSSSGAGFEAYDSQFEMVSCEIKANGDVGVKLGGGISQGGRMKFENVLIARNGKAGLHSTSQQLEMLNCTIVDNGESGIKIISPLQEVRISTTLIAGNHGFGIEREATPINQDQFFVVLGNLFGNLAGNWFLPQMDSSLTAKLVSDNLSVDPKFTDALAFDYSPVAGSKLDSLEKQAPPLVIGYRRPGP